VALRTQSKFRKAVVLKNSPRAPRLRVKLPLFPRDFPDASNTNRFFMKIPIHVAGYILVLAVSVWCVKAGLDIRCASSKVEIVGSMGDPPVGGTALRCESQSLNGRDARSPCALPASSAPAVQQMVAPATRAGSEPGVHYGMAQEAMPTATRPTSSTPVLPPVSSQESRPSTSGQPTYPAGHSTISSAAVSSSANPAAADPGAFELDPGVPAPAALMPPPGNQSPAAAAAQQQLADAFVQDVNAALNQPGTTDAAASDSYFHSLDKANEQYRALYGNDAYNGASLQAGMDAQAGK